MRLRLDSFRGEYPRTHETRLLNDGAVKAQDVKLDSGALEAMFKSQQVVRLQNGTGFLKDFYLWRIAEQDYWLQFPSLVHLVRSPVADDQHKRVYWTGDTRDADGAMLTSYTPAIHQGGGAYPSAWYRNGVPAPSNAVVISEATTERALAQPWEAGKEYKTGQYVIPSAPDPEIFYRCERAGVSGTSEPEWPETSGQEVDDGEVKWLALSAGVFANFADESRTYVYTYVNTLGEESAPSPPSELIVTPNGGSVVTLTGFALDAEATQGRIIEYFRIYRSAVASNGAVDALFVAQIPITQTTFVDKVHGTELAEGLPTLGYDSPRNGMQGLGLTAHGVAYAFTGKTVCFTEPYLMYAWPREYEITTQYDVVAIGHYDTQVVVATKGRPVIINGIDPRATTVLELPVVEACVSSKSMVSMGGFAMYASPNGLVMVEGASARVVTESLFGRDEWLALNPSSIHAVDYSGKYLFFWRNGDRKGAYLFDPRRIELGIVSLSCWGIASHRDIETENIYVLSEAGDVLLINPDTGELTPFTWRSKKYNFDRPTRFLAAQVIADSYSNLTLDVLADGRLLRSVKVRDERIFRLPNHSPKRDFQFQVCGTDVVREIALGETVRDLLG